MKWSEVAQLCPTLCNPMDCSPPGSSFHGILQARILERVAISFSRRSSQPRYWTWVSCIASRFLTVWATGEAPGTISVHSVHWFFHSSNHLWARCFYNPHFVDEEECTGKLNNFLWITQLQSETESEPRNLAPEPTCWSLFLVIWLWLSPTEISAKVDRTAKEQLDRGPRGPQLQPWL